MFAIAAAFGFAVLVVFAAIGAGTVLVAADEFMTDIANATR